MIDVYDEVKNRLYDLEEEYNITVLYAVESGSRMWGFSNMDSDYDIRFIYKYNDLHEYIRLGKRQEVINFFEEDFDFEGWDISKTLYLHYKDNPNLREWLKSPLKYIDTGRLNVLNDIDYNQGVLLHHYSSMAWNNWNKFCEGIVDWIGTDDEDFLIKKYLYVLRCILTFDLLKSTTLDPNVRVDELLKQHYDSFNEDFQLYSSIILLIKKYKRADDSLSYKNISFLYDYIMEHLKSMRRYCKNLKVKNDKDFKCYEGLYYEYVME